MSYTSYSVAHTQVDAVFEQAQRYRFDMYKKYLNSYVTLWCIDLPKDNKNATLLYIQFGEYLTKL